MRCLTRLFFLLLLMPLSVWAQEAEVPRQNIRGTVVDEASGQPIVGANVRVMELQGVGGTTDAEGRYLIASVPVGRYTLQARMFGYATAEVREQLLLSAKELVVDIVMTEMGDSLREVVVKVNKQRPVNSTATVGARMFSVDEISRTPGGLEDPARLAANFAGVSTDGASNGISIHGNAPHLLAWRIEGVEVPNPNHFADGVVGGAGVYSALSTKVLDNSDFFTSAFPSEYYNAVSGIFDVRLRNGNAERYEHTAQVGVLGLEAGSEGPIGKRGGASYLVNYRYSFVGLATDLKLINMKGHAMNYQDLNFKLNLPTRRAGTFTLWGTGLVDRYHKPQKDSLDWAYNNDHNATHIDQKMFALGLGHRYTLPRGAFLRTTLAYTLYNEQTDIDYFYNRRASNPYHRTNKTDANLVLTTSYNQRFSNLYTLRAGATYMQLFSQTDIHRAPSHTGQLQPLVDNHGSTTLLSAFVNNQLHVGRAKMNLGATLQYLTLSRSLSVEPRIGLEYALSEHLTLAAGYGMHSRKERNDVYFVQRGGQLVNDDLGLTRAHHVTTSLSWRINGSTTLRLEPYFQYLYNIPVEPGTGFCMTNSTDFIIDRDLAPDGRGRNYGLDVTLERYLQGGWFAMATGSFFSSRFRAADGRWYHSRYDRNYIVNLIVGREWVVGRKRNRIINAAVKYTHQGADRTSPVDVARTTDPVANPDHMLYYDETRLYTERFPFVPVFGFSFSYKVNRARVAHSIVADWQHAYSFLRREWNFAADTYENVKFNLSFPQIAYRLDF